MNAKILAQALKFACLPTLSVLVLLFFGFFSISKTIAFISSDDSWAVFLRVTAVIAEIILVTVMYKQYESEEQKKMLINNPENFLERCSLISSNERVYSVLNGNSSDDYYVYPTSNPNIKLIERKYQLQN